ncbi:MAG: hypothetical protein ACUVQG_03120 [Thermogutta sp.]
MISRLISSKSNEQHLWWKWSRALFVFSLFTLILRINGLPQAQAQLSSGGQTPPPAYFDGMAFMNEGDYRDALQMFDLCYRSAIRFGTRRFMDSVCYLAMMGECYYHMGQFDKAYDNYTAALELALSYPTWMQQVTLPPSGPTPLSSAINRSVPWGERTRKTVLSQLPSTGLYTYAQIIVDPKLQEQGAIVPQEARSINVAEVIRCTALAIRRRYELLGPLSLADPASRPTSSVFSSQYTLPNHWSQSWGDLLAGLSAVGEGRISTAIPLLTRATTTGGQFEHQLSAIALIELGKLALARADYAAARTFFHEATCDAFYYGDAILLEEAFRLMAIAHLVSRAQEVDPTLVQALAWAKSKRLSQLQASLNLAIAEQALSTGNMGAATIALDDAKSVISRRQMVNGRAGVKLAYLCAVALLRSGAAAQGETALTSVLPSVQRCSLWLFQLNRLSRVYSLGQISLRGPITPRTAHELYALVLRDPTNLDWATDPMECLAVTTTPHLPLFEQWFAIAWQRKQWEDAIEIADRARRHRFQSALPWGGRLDALRRLLESPENVLDNQARLERKNLLARFPQYAALSQRSQQIRDELKNTSLIPQNADEQVALQKKWQSWADLARQQEALLRAMLVDREATGVPFPPVVKLKEIQSRLPDATILWSFFISGNNVFVFFIGKDRYDTWQVRGGVLALQKQIPQLLLSLGLQDANREFSLKDLADTGWQQAAENLASGLVAGSNADLGADFAELIVVPDGLLWYLPFEALRVKVNGEILPLIAKHRIRYAITSSLSVRFQPSDGLPQPRTLLFLGRVNPQEDPVLVEKRAQQILQSIPGAVMLSASDASAPPVFLGKLFDQMIVLDDLQGTYSPFAWAPLGTGRASGALSDWLTLPYEAPRLIVLPGFHTASENALRKSEGTLGGHEIPLSLAALQALGVQTMVVGRWRTGGGTMASILKEFLQEWPQTSAAAAFQRAVLLASSEPLDPNDEPRVQKKTPEKQMTKSHPFLWANMFLVDPGVFTPVETNVPAKAAQQDAGKPNMAAEKENDEQKEEKPAEDPKPAP